MTNESSIVTPPRKKNQVAGHVDAGERHVRSADLSGRTKFPNPSDRQWDDPEEHHDRAVHAPELVVEGRQHRARRGPRLAQTVRSADRRPGKASCQRMSIINEKPNRQEQQPVTAYWMPIVL
jgi:hypothetical protein